MKNYVINLERASDRREVIAKNFDHYGIEFEFFTAIDWVDLTENDVRDNVDSKFLAKSKKWINPMDLHGMLACWLSHRILWKNAVADEQSEIISIFEDDATLTSDTKAALEAITKLEKQNFEFDIIFLYDSKRPKPLIPVCKIDERFALNLVKYSSMGAVGYVISRRAINVLLNHFPLMNVGIDELMHWYWLTGLKTYVLSPQVVFHGDMESSIHHHSFAGEPSGTNEIRQWKITNPSLYTRIRAKSELKKLLEFPSRLVFKYIPQRLAFRKRLKYESL